MRIDWLEGFLAVLEAGSIRAAARGGGLSQPALTKRLRLLEQDLGVRLFTRTHAGMVLTDYGRRFAPRARAVRAELRKAREEIDQLAGGLGGQVSVGIGPVSATLLLPRVLPRLRASFPEARLRVVEGLPHVLVPMVRDERLDFALGARISGEIGPGLLFRPLYDSPRTILVRRGHPLAGATSVTELAGSEWLSLPALSSGTLRPWPKWLGQTRQLVECESYSSAAALLAATDMVGLVSRRFVGVATERAGLVEVPVRERLPSFRVGLYRRRDATLTPLAAATEAALLAAGHALASGTG